MALRGHEKGDGVRAVWGEPVGEMRLRPPGVSAGVRRPPGVVSPAWLQPAGVRRPPGVSSPASLLEVRRPTSRLAVMLFASAATVGSEAKTAPTETLPPSSCRTREMRRIAAIEWPPSSKNES